MLIKTSTKNLFCLLFIGSLFLGACSDSSTKEKSTDSQPPVEDVSSSSSPKTSPPKIEAAVVEMDVYKSPTCGCCNKWIDHVKAGGFTIKGHEYGDRATFKAKHGIKQAYQSCHTGISKEGFVFEGHIPVKFIKRFLAEKPEGAHGLTVPAMPVGSPGMEVGDKFMPYQIFLLKEDGGIDHYADVKTMEEQF